MSIRINVWFLVGLLVLVYILGGVTGTQRNKTIFLKGWFWDSQWKDHNCYTHDVFPKARLCIWRNK